MPSIFVKNKFKDVMARQKSNFFFQFWRTIMNYDVFYQIFTSVVSTCKDKYLVKVHVDIILLIKVKSNSILPSLVWNLNLIGWFWTL